MHASPALDEYVLAGHGSHKAALFSRDPLGHVHDSAPTDPVGDVDPAGHGAHRSLSASR